MDSPLTCRHHAFRVIGLMAVAAAVLTALAARTDIIVADGLRYIDQAGRISLGEFKEGFFRSIDHPGYPLAVALAHAVAPGDGPLAWQRAAQGAAVLAGVLLVIPLYLVGLELFGPRAAWLGCLLVYLAPIPGRVMADAYSESTFLLFWTWGLWAAIHFLRYGSPGWLPPAIACGLLAYLTRPEGVLLPAALVASLLVIPFIPSIRLAWPRWAAAICLLVVLPLCVVGPYVLAKGGLGTKPALARVLGLTAQAPADSVERARPLDPNQSAAKTYALALKGAAGAVAEAVSIPLLPLAILGIWGGMTTTTGAGARTRTRLFLAMILIGAFLALVRLHATNGYCTPRHALLVGLLGISAAAAGLERLCRRLPLPVVRLSPNGEREASPALVSVLVASYLAWSAPALWRPLNHEALGYRQAGEWLADRGHAPEGAKVVDGPAWSLFYGQRAGYTFANLREAAADPQARFVVVREAHLAGPWWYCQTFQGLVQGLEPIASFPEYIEKGQSRVLLFDRQGPRSPGSEMASGGQGDRRTR